jgi:hypothetical protein
VTELFFFLRAAEWAIECLVKKRKTCMLGGEEKVMYTLWRGYNMAKEQRHLPRAVKISLEKALRSLGCSKLRDILPLAGLYYTCWIAKILDGPVMYH